MKLFQKLLLAPAALGLLAPVAASASDLASAGGLNNYIQQNDLHNFRVWSDQNQVTNVQQFNDVKPTDWAYQALSNLIERYGCVAGYPNGTFKGGQAMTRFEAAALLNACLDRVTETTDEIQRLQADFAKELAVLKGRVDGLEKKVGKLEATQFSTTTKLQGDTYWSIGGVGFGGTGNGLNNATYGGTVFNYDLRLNLNTSFTGKDLLYTRLRAGNYVGSPFSGNPYNLMGMDRAFAGGGQGSSAVNGAFWLDRLYYRAPLGNGKVNKQFTYFVGPMARNTEFLAVSPSYYGAFEGLDFFRLHGAPGTYNKATGGMAGLQWKQDVKKGKPFFAISSSYVAPNANSGNTNYNNSASSPSASGQGGIFGNNSGASWLTQIGYQAKQWKGTFAYNYTQCGAQQRRGTQAAVAIDPCNTIATNMTQNAGAYVNNFAVGLAWEPKKSGTVVPSASLGWGYSAWSFTRNTNPGANWVTGSTYTGAAGVGSAAGNLTASNIAATNSWTVGLQWKDAFSKGNTAGMAVGQPTFVTATNNGTTPFDGNYAWEWWYQLKLSDNISVTPMLFYLSNPGSYGAGGTQNAGQINPNVFGGLMSASFKF